MYVIAPSGLLLRKEDNVDSEQMGKMPYGASVKVLSRPDNSSIEVSGIEGHMIQVQYNDITGYAYDGYLTRFKVPQRKETPERYASRLKEDFPKVSAGSGNGEKIRPLPLLPNSSFLPEAGVKLFNSKTTVRYSCGIQFPRS